MDSPARSRRLATLVLALSLLMGTAMPADAQRADATAAIATAERFLLAWGHRRPGFWDHAAGPTIMVRIGQSEQTLRRDDPAPAVTLVFPFKGLTTVRAGAEVKGVAVQALCLKVREQAQCGQGTLTLTRTGDAYRVTAVSLAVEGSR